MDFYICGLMENLDQATMVILWVVLQVLDLNSTIDSRAIYASAMSTVFDIDFKKITKDVFWGENLPNLSDKLFKV